MNSSLSQDLNPHLNEEQFAECALGGEVDARAAAHLATCEACRAELADFASSVESFNTASMAWSEAQPAKSLRSLVRSRKPQPAWAIASWALAGCLTLASAVSIATHRQRGDVAADSQTVAETEDSAAQIERDNKLLLAVDQATSMRPSSPLQEYGLEAPSTRHALPTERE